MQLRIFFPDRIRTDFFNRSSWKVPLWEGEIIPGQNEAKGYAAGLDMKLFGQFVPGVDSWLTFSLMKTQEEINGVMLFAPMFDVMMTAVLRKSTLRPCASVTTPSSKICSRMFHTSSCAFSISSKSTTEYGLRRTFSVSCPPSS